MTLILPRAFSQNEEDFFNKSFVKSVNGLKVRCGEIRIEETWEPEIFQLLENNYVNLVSNILKRIISTETPFPNYTDGRRAIKVLKSTFRKEFKACVHPESNTGLMLKNRDICAIVCTIAVSTLDVGTFEGAYGVEFLWHAEYYRGNELRRKPIIHCFNSQKDRGVPC